MSTNTHAQRPRAPSQYSNQSEWGLDVTEEDDFILARRYNAQEKFREYQAREDQGLVKEMNGEGWRERSVLVWVECGERGS